jgi:hypothetical protein
MPRKDRIEVYWDTDGEGWAWRYGARSGGLSPDIATSAASLADEARNEVWLDPLCDISEAAAAGLPVAVFNSFDGSAPPTIIEGE